LKVGNAITVEGYALYFESFSFLHVILCRRSILALIEG
jgi:hypothetical protein